MISTVDRELYNELSRLNNELVNTQRETFKLNAVLETQTQELLRTNAELEDANRRLESLAALDGLTGLSNHRVFQEQLAAEVQRAIRYQTPLALVMLDVDHFKRYNDAYGHPAGDEVLKRVAALLQKTNRETDLAARYGGEEFVVILPETDRNGARTAAERIRAAIAFAPWENRAVTVSLGVCCLSPNAADPAALIACADKALYRSKNEGKNRVTCGDPADGPSPSAITVLKRRTKENHEAIERKMAPLLGGITRREYLVLLQRLLCYYQPLEARIMALPEWRGGSPGMERRKKSQLLMSDIEYLGVNSGEWSCLPRCEHLPEVKDITQALGCQYVLEGATLGGQIILRHLRQHFGVDAGRGGSFFASYGENVGPMWRAFGRFVNERCASREAQGALVRAARETFDTMNHWLAAGESENREIPG